MTHRPSVLRAGAPLLALVVLAGCSVSTNGTDDEPAAQPPAVTAEPSGGAVLTPVDSPPRDSREVGTGEFSLFAPADFTQSERPGPADVPMLVLSGPSDDPGTVVEVVAFSDPEPGGDVADQMSVLVAELQDIRGASDVRRTDLEWPGTETAVLVRWTEDTAVASGTVTQTFAQLTVQAEDGRTATAVAVAPADDFESSGVLDVLRSFSVERV